MEKLRWPLLSPGARVLVAVSGGPDSLTLLHALHMGREAHGLAALEAAHLDHGLRGEESGAEAAWVAAWCAERGIPCHLGYADVAALAKARKCSKQEAARAARYDFLAATAATIGANQIATAHTQDDQIETVLLHILRGTGLDGLRGIPVERSLYVRPLLNISRAEIEAYCLEHGLTPCRDPSNLSPDCYTRNRVRIELLPLLARDYNPAVGNALLRLSEIAGRESDFLHQQAQAAVQDATLAKTPGKRILSRTTLAALHPALLRHTLRAAVSEVRGTAAGIAYQHIERLCQLVLQSSFGSGSPTLQGLFPAPHCNVCIDPDHVILMQAFSPLPAPDFSQMGWTLQTSTVPAPAEFTAQIDADKVDQDSLYIRSWQEGDKIAPLGMGGQHKKVSDIFTAAKVPRAERYQVPILTDEGGIVWVVGYALAERVKVTESTMQTLFLTVNRVQWE